MNPSIDKNCLFHLVHKERRRKMNLNQWGSVEKDSPFLNENYLYSRQIDPAYSRPAVDGLREVDKFLLTR